jgi:hypothetical protein
MVMKKVVNFTKDIKLVNDGYNNKIIYGLNNEIVEEITDTLVGAKNYIIKKYNVIQLPSFRHRESVVK